MKEIIQKRRKKLLGIANIIEELKIYLLMQISFVDVIKNFFSIYVNLCMFMWI